MKRRRDVRAAARAVCTAPWRARVRQQLGSSVDPALWADRPQPCTLEDCRAYAQAARNLLRLRTAAQLLPGDLVHRLWLSREPASFTTAVARSLYVGFSAPAEVGMLQAAKCLQVAGILCCTVAGRTVDECECLHDFSEDLVLDTLEAELQRMTSPDAWPQS